MALESKSSDLFKG